MPHYGLIEGGGTKFVLGIADASGKLAATTRIPTTGPDETLSAAIAWFLAQHLEPHAIGIASFGPLELDRANPDWGHLTKTVKPHWSHADLAGPFMRTFACPVGLETDVDGAALAEMRWGAGTGQGSLLYLTVGTGIGGGFVGGGELLRGASHPEMGHIRLPRHPDDAGFSGSCPFHGDCLEGLASGTAIRARWGAALSDLGADHPGHAVVGWYLGQAVTTLRAVLQPARIVLGGGVMQTPGLLDRVRQEASAAGKGYFAGEAAEIIVAPGLGANSGLMGALAVALAAR